jgi:hypothetical protein
MRFVFSFHFPFLFLFVLLIFCEKIPLARFVNFHKLHFGKNGAAAAKGVVLLSP